MLNALPSSAMRVAADFNAPRDVGVEDFASDETSDFGELSVEFVSGVDEPEPDSSDDADADDSDVDEVDSVGLADATP